MANDPLRCRPHNDHLCAVCRHLVQSHDIKKIIGVNVIPEDKNRCHIMYSCHLLDGRVVIYDKANRRLKIVDPSRNAVTLFGSISGELNVKGLCCIGPKEIAVSFDTTQVQVFSTENMTFTHIINLGTNAHSMAFDGNLLYESNNTLYEYDLKKRNTQKILPQVIADEYIFPVVIHSITVNGSGDRIYVAARKCGLICVDKKGQKIFRLTAKDLGMHETWCVTSDDRDNVYVIGSNINWPRSVVVVTPEGKVGGQIFTSELGIEYPMSVAYSVPYKSLFVGGDSQYIIRYYINN